MVYEWRGCASPKKNKKNKKCDFARMAEWSKAVDLSPTISGCAGSNPASRIFFSIGLYSSEVEHHTCNVGVSGSIPDEGNGFAC
jgi:hypothetical protein